VKTEAKAPTNRVEVFATWDVDRDGFLSPAEFQTGLKNHPESAERFRARDKDGDQKLNREEFVNPIGK
jgi:Ca2+-binding EF-hand superfamily protein